MIILRLVVHLQRRDFGDDGVGEIFLSSGLGFLSRLFLFLILVEDHGSVLRAAVRPLPVERGRVMRRPE